MAVKPDVVPAAASEVAAQRRWLITIAVTIVFGGFGAVMAYLSYANSDTPAPRSSGTSPRSAPATPPATTPPATAPTSTAPPAAEPPSDKGKPDKDK